MSSHCQYFCSLHMVVAELRAQSDMFCLLLASALGFGAFSFLPYEYQLQAHSGFFFVSVYILMGHKPLQLANTKFFSVWCDFLLGFFLTFSIRVSV